MPTIEFKDVSKTFKTKVLYKNVNLVVEKGDCIGLVGANGSGKSVLFSLLLD